MEDERDRLRQLDALVGDWTIKADFSDAPDGRVTFEWMPGESFLIERWEVPVPEAPDGMAIIGWDAEKALFVQHYFDSRGVARLYQMTLSDGVWKLWRDSADLSAFDFGQRYEGVFSNDGRQHHGHVGDLPRRNYMGEGLRPELREALMTETIAHSQASSA
jgi:hypothetical protein